MEKHKELTVIVKLSKCCYRVTSCKNHAQWLKYHDCNES